MFRKEPPFDLRALLERERPLRGLSPIVRARALARARAALRTPPLVVVHSRFHRAPHPMRWAVAALVILAGAAGAAAAYELGVHTRGQAGVAFPVAVLQTASPIGDEVPAPSRAPAPAGTSRSPSRAAPAAVELALLQRARSAVARRDFSAAMTALREYARRFPNGRLIEERDALRVKALCGLGRRTDARRAFVAFERRFPRSPLLQALGQIADSTRQGSASADLNHL